MATITYVLRQNSARVEWVSERPGVDVATLEAQAREELAGTNPIRVEAKDGGVVLIPPASISFAVVR